MNRVQLESFLQTARHATHALLDHSVLQFLYLQVNVHQVMFFICGLVYFFNLSLFQEPIQLLLGKPLLRTARFVYLEITVFLGPLSEPRVQLVFTVRTLLAELHVGVELTVHQVLCNQALVQQAVCVSPHQQYEIALLGHIVHKTAQLNFCVRVEITVLRVLCNRILVQLVACV